MEKKKIRIFISSPGDVQQERKIARKVISELNELYSKFVEIEILMWEDFPLTVDSTFQEGIDFFLKEDVIDYAIFILWSRLGTPLCSKFLKPDGTPYQSGTEYEYDLMWDLYRKKGAPRILTYKKTTEPLLVSRNAEELLELIHQKEGVKSFIAEHFHDESTNSNYAYLQFEEETSFETKLRDHLKQLIRRQLGSVGEIREWDGNPYVGLNSFEYEQSSIFYGRRQLVYETAAQLISDENVKRSLIVLGESGSGKSSFVKAGLLPFLCKDESGDDYVIVNPSMYGGNVYSGLIDLLVDKHIFLKDNPFVEELRKGIDENSNFKYLSHALKNNNHNDKIIYIDQFEELFSDTSITEEERLKVILLLKGIISTQCISVFITMRSDFYNRFSLYGHLTQIKEWSVVVDLPVISHSEISEIVEEPAKKACLKWEIDNKGNALNEKIVSDAAKINDLPLIEFALSELYNMRDENDCLTFEAYNEIGELKGAIVSYADKFYNQLNEKEKEALKEIFGFVIAVSSYDKNTYVRKTSLLKELQRKEITRSVVKKLIDSHILVTGKDHVGQPTITIVHEILIKYWSVIQTWIKEQKEFLQSNVYYEQRTQHWLNKNKSSKDLVQERSALLEVEYFIYKYSDLISEDTKEYLLSSLKKERRKGLVKHCFIFLGLLLIYLSASLIFLLDLPIDKDLSDWFDIVNTKIWDIIPMGIMVLVISGQTVLLRCLGKPSYKTIKSTSFIWLLIVLYAYIDSLCWFVCDDEVDGFVFVIPTIFFMVGVSVWIELYRRKLWRKSVFKPYLFSDRFAVFKNIIVYSTIAFFALLILGSYVGVLNEKNERLESTNERLESTIQVTDLLFDGLNNVNSRLTPSENIYVNDLRKKYISERFFEELQDAIPDDREYQYAICLYNLYYPVASNSYLYYFQDSRGIFLNILNYSMLGEYKQASHFLEHRIGDVWSCTLGNHNVLDLIWIAEKGKRFDLAASLYEIIEENGFDWKNQGSAYWVNYGHIHLMNGDYNRAMWCYDYASEWEQRNNPILKPQVIKSQIENSIKNDFQLFNWLDINTPLIEKVRINRNYPQREFYTNIGDTLQTRKYQESVAGMWMLSDSTIIMTYSEKTPICQYSLYDNGSEIKRALTSYRSSYKNGRIYLEELDDETGIVSSKEVVFLDENTLKIRIIENSSDIDKGKVRTYKRIE